MIGPLRAVATGAAGAKWNPNHIRSLDRQGMAAIEGRLKTFRKLRKGRPFKASECRFLDVVPIHGVPRHTNQLSNSLTEPARAMNGIKPIFPLSVKIYTLTPLHQGFKPPQRPLPQRDRCRSSCDRRKRYQSAPQLAKPCSRAAPPWEMRLADGCMDGPIHPL